MTVRADIVRAMAADTVVATAISIATAKAKARSVVSTTVRASSTAMASVVTTAVAAIVAIAATIRATSVMASVPASVIMTVVTAIAGISIVTTAMVMASVAISVMTVTVVTSAVTMVSGRNFHKDGDRRDFRRDDRRGERRDGERRNFRRDDRRDGGRRDFRRDNQRRDFHKDRDQRPEGEERREFTREEKMEYREAKRGEYLSKPRRNSDGTMSFPSQNPYTHRRPGEPKMPKGIEWSMLSTDDRERLRGLSKEHAENIGLHILAAYTLEERDPELALEHAKWVAHQASRIDFARETLAFVAYRQGDYKLALREFRTAFRMNGFLDYLPFIADCERGMGEPKKAIETAMSDDAKYLRGESKAEMFLVYAGALGDLELWNKAIEIVHTLGRSKGLAGEYRMRAVQAEQYFLEQAGRSDEAVALDQLLDKLELQYADAEEDETSDDLVIEYDMQELNDELMDKLGISEDDAQYAPEDEDEDDSEAVDENGETNDETQLDAEAAKEGAESDDEPAGDGENAGDSEDDQTEDEVESAADSDNE